MLSLSEVFVPWLRFVENGPLRSKMLFKNVPFVWELQVWELDTFMSVMSIYVFIVFVDEFFFTKRCIIIKCC